MKNYKIIKKLGEGKFGIVYLVKKGNKEYAMKDIKISKDNVDYDDVIETTDKEIKILKKLKQLVDYEIKEYKSPNSKLNPNSVGDNNMGGINYKLIVPYIKAIDLSKLSNKKKMKVFLKVIEKLHELHTKYGIIHNDIKPENIMVEKNYNVYIIDYGLSCYTKNNKANVKCISNLNGSLTYNSPTLYRMVKRDVKDVEAINAGIKGDWWALGISFYVITYGSFPKPYYQSMTEGDDIQKNMKKLILYIAKLDNEDVVDLLPKKTSEIDEIILDLLKIGSNDKMDKKSINRIMKKYTHY